jgi:hypothetical protein
MPSIGCIPSIAGAFGHGYNEEGNMEQQLSTQAETERKKSIRKLVRRGFLILG